MHAGVMRVRPHDDARGFVFAQRPETELCLSPVLSATEMSTAARGPFKTWTTACEAGPVSSCGGSRSDWVIP